eukprot:TRINITY_DN6224_c0_g1_i1.p1 TRINITY_DN6224_c0_g1~~TRINITY_DN6224_c0_g1_i1.p1  ORF type:complete len:209 (-),score=71.79 TRINITY_DN6224_c0_g1_i1:71-697(-)
MDPIAAKKFAKKVKLMKMKNLTFKKWKIIRGDFVIVTTGKDRGKKGTVKRCIRGLNRVVVEGVNLVKKQVPATKDTKAGSITMEAPIHYSNLAHIDPVDGKPCKVGFKFDERGNKLRVSKRSGSVIAKNYPLFWKEANERKKIEGPLDTGPKAALRYTFDRATLLPMQYRDVYRIICEEEKSEKKKLKEEEKLKKEKDQNENQIQITN